MLLPISKKNVINIFLMPLLLLILCFAACDEEEVYSLSNQDEILRYITDDVDGQDLFRNSNLFLTDIYTMVADEGYEYQDLVDSSKRNFYLDISSKYELRDYGAYLAQDAEVEINDVFYIRTIRSQGDSSDVITRRLNLKRYAYFIKLGNNSQAYSGWKLMGFNYGGAYPQVPSGLKKDGGSAVYPDGGLTYDYFEYLLYDTSYNSSGGIDSIRIIPGKSNFEYIELTEIPDLTDDNILTMESADFLLISAETSSGFKLHTSVWDGDENYIDTLYLPRPNLRLWNLILLRYPEITISGDSLGILETDLITPYRIPQ